MIKKVVAVDYVWIDHENNLCNETSSIKVYFIGIKIWEKSFISDHDSMSDSDKTIGFK